MVNTSSPPSSRSGVGINRVKRFLTYARDYQRNLIKFIIEEDKRDKSSPHLLFSYFLSKEPVDLNSLPKLNFSERDLNEIGVQFMMDIFILFLFNLFSFMGGFVSLIKYDVR